ALARARGDAGGGARGDGAARHADRALSGDAAARGAAAQHAADHADAGHGAARVRAAVLPARRQPEALSGAAAARLDRSRRLQPAARQRDDARRRRGGDRRAAISAQPHQARARHPRGRAGRGNGAHHGHQFHRHRAGYLRDWFRARRFRRRDERPLLQRDQFRHRPLSRRHRLFRRHHRRARQHLRRHSRRPAVRRAADRRHRAAALRQRLQGRVRLHGGHRHHGLAADRLDPRKNQRAGVIAMAAGRNDGRAALWPGIAALAVATAYLIALLAVERPAVVIALLAAGIAVVVAVAWLGLFGRVSRAFAEHENRLALGAVAAAIALAAVFHEDHFVLLLVTTVLLYSVATLGLNIQFGYAGVLNFAGASFFG